MGEDDAPRSRPRCLRAAFLTAGCVLLVPSLAVPAAGHATENNANMRQVGHVSIPGAMSIAFSSREPVAYVNARKNGGVVATLDISDPARPKQLAEIPVVSGAYMEDMSIGERPDGTTFLLVRERDGLRIVDVTDPHLPKKRGFIDIESHTWSCLSPQCYYAYSTRAGLADPAHFAIVNLENLDAPVYEGIGTSSVGVIHDWNRDSAGVMWATGGNGLSAYDTRNPLAPALLNTSDLNGTAGHSEHNDKIQLHGSLRPDAERFRPRDGIDSADVKRGNVLLVSEEGNNHDCTDSFQTWFVPHLDANRLASDNPTGAPGGGSITPLDTWSLNSADPATRPIASQFCSVHWFDYHPAGFVAISTYGSGTRILDVRNPRQVEQVAYHFDADDQAIQSYWVREHGTGSVAGRTTGLVYTADAGAYALVGASTGVGGGVDIFEVKVSGLN